MINAQGLSLLGYSLGTATPPDIGDYYLDPAFTGTQVRCCPGRLLPPRPSLPRLRLALARTCFGAHLQAVFNLEPACTGPGPAAATSFLDTILAQVRDGGATGNITTGGQQAECVAEVLVQQPNATAVNRQLYCGFYQARPRRSCRFLLC